jgi:hypothetical protein
VRFFAARPGSAGVLTVVVTFDDRDGDWCQAFFPVKERGEPVPAAVLSEQPRP